MEAISQVISRVWTGWQVGELIGRGAYGVVYRATYADTGEQAAVKIIEVPQDRYEIVELRGMGMDDASIRSSLEETALSIAGEVDAMRSLQGCEHVVHVEDSKLVTRDDGMGWTILIRMELLEALSSRIARWGIPNQYEVARMGADVCDALQSCHERGIIHRDVKPENIFLDGNGGYKLGDFGISRNLDETTRSTKSFAGSRPFMAPEVEGGHYGTSVDLYSLGIVLYRYLNGGRPPFLPAKGPISQAVLRRAEARRFASERPEPPSGEGVDSWLAEIVLKAVEPDPADRWQSAEKMGRALQNWLDSHGDGDVIAARDGGTVYLKSWLEDQEPEHDTKTDEMAKPAAEEVTGKATIADEAVPEVAAEAEAEAVPVTPEMPAPSHRVSTEAQVEAPEAPPQNVRKMPGAAIAAVALVVLAMVVLSLMNPQGPSSGGGSGSNSGSSSTSSSSSSSSGKSGSSSTKSDSSASKSSSSSSNSSSTSSSSSSSNSSSSSSSSSSQDTSESSSDTSSSSSSDTSSEYTGSRSVMIDTSYENEYFRVDVPSSWSGEWTVTEYPNPNNPSLIDRWAFGYIDAFGGAEVKLGNGLVDDFESIGTINLGYIEGYGYDAIGIMMRQWGYEFFNDGMATLTLKNPL